MIDQLWLLICAGLVLLMQAGFMCLESGLTRSKNSINVAVKNLSDFGVSVFLFWAIGYGLMFGLSANGWFGTQGFFFRGESQPDITSFFIFQAMFCGTATTIISGAVAERLKFLAYIIICILSSGLLYPLFGHWAWGDQGWLHQMGFIDFAGSTVVHGMGAWTSLATLIVIGPREGRFTANTINKIPGSNLPFAVLGALILWVGWIGFNGGSTFALNDQVPHIILNTVLSGVGGMISALLISSFDRSHVEIEVEDVINGSLAGLVAITACCHLVTNPIAMVIGFTAAGVTKISSGLLKKYRIDDAVDAIAVHGAAGLWGTIAVALFGQIDHRYTQLGIQLVGIGVAMVWGIGLPLLILGVLHRFYPLRVSPEAEAIGLNISEHGAKTATYELFEVMDRQARHQDLTLRVPVEPFTEIGHIATRYNQVIDALERNHRENQESLEELYAITATAVSVVENQNFDPDIFTMFSDRGDDLGILASSLQQILVKINQQQRQLQTLQSEQQQHWRMMLGQIFHYRFHQPASYYEEQLLNLQLPDVAEAIPQAFTIASFEEFIAIVNPPRP